jgi:hypothetical protein
MGNGQNLILKCPGKTYCTLKGEGLYPDLAPWINDESDSYEELPVQEEYPYE